MTCVCPTPVACARRDGCRCKYTPQGERADVLGCPVHAVCRCRMLTRVADCPIHGRRDWAIACRAMAESEGEIDHLRAELAAERTIANQAAEIKALRLQRDTLGRELDRAHVKAEAARRELAIERRAHELACELACDLSERGMSAQQWAIACRAMAESEGDRGTRAQYAHEPGRGYTIAAMWQLASALAFECMRAVRP